MAIADSSWLYHIVLVYTNIYTNIYTHKKTTDDIVRELKIVRQESYHIHHKHTKKKNQKKYKNKTKIQWHLETKCKYTPLNQFLYLHLFLYTDKNVQKFQHLHFIEENNTKTYLSIPMETLENSFKWGTCMLKAADLNIKFDDHIFPSKWYSQLTPPVQ